MRIDLHGLLREDLPLTDLLDAEYTYANEALANLYQLGTVEGSALRKIVLEDRNLRFQRSTGNDHFLDHFKTPVTAEKTRM